MPRKRAQRVGLGFTEGQMVKPIVLQRRFDLPIDLQTTQHANARWDGENIDLTLAISIEGQLELFRTAITCKQARLFKESLQAALDKCDE
jgi:hypothetical protein